MALEDAVSPDVADWPFNSHKLLLGGLGAALLVFGLYCVPPWLYRMYRIDLGHFVLNGTFWTLFQLLLIAAGALLAGGAVALRPRDIRVVFGAGLAALLIGWGMDPAWDTAQLVMRLLAMVAFAAAFLLLLPTLMAMVYRGWYFLFPGNRNETEQQIEKRGRFAGWVLSRAIVSVMVVLHFVGIASAVMSASSGGRESAYLALWIHDRWAAYLDFMYLNNAYKFYSPDPGPPALLWFHIEYADPTAPGGYRYRWVKIPTRPDDAPDPLSQEFTRRLSIAESVAVSPVPFMPESVKQARVFGGERVGIPPHPHLPIDAQYAVPQPMSQRLIGEYAAFVARNYPCPENPSAPVNRVKVYRVVHIMLEPRQMASEKVSPTEDWTYRPYYFGEFTPEGRLTNPNDPLLYWLIPRFAGPKGRPYNPLDPNPPPVELVEYDVHDFLETHARLRSAPVRKEAGQ